VGRFSSEIRDYEYRPPDARRPHRARPGQRPARGHPDHRPGRHDNYYIDNWSLWMDAKIILRTFREVLLTKGR